jgi:medium-chain acyl-[acyl-carrier-protein] hydrolase
MSELTENNLTTFSSFEVTSADTDMHGRIRLGSLVNLLIQSAIHSADNLGFGYGGIRQQNLFWVLSRLTLVIDRPLKWHEIIQVETWPKNVERILYLRDFILRDNEGNVVGKATTGWLAVDIETKQLKKIDGIHSGFFIHLKEKHAIAEPPEKVLPVSGGDSFDIKTGYYDADLNKHITTTRYVDWMMDTFPVDFHTECYPRKLSLNIMKETMPGDILKIMRNKGAKGEYYFEGENISKNVSAFRSCIKF